MRTVTNTDPPQDDERKEGSEQAFSESSTSEPQEPFGTSETLIADISMPSDPQEDTEAKTMMYDSLPDQEAQEGKTIMFSSDSPLGTAFGPSGLEPKTLQFDDSKAFSHDGQIRKLPTGSDEKLMRVWEAAIGSSSKHTRQSLRYELPEASDSMVGRVALRMVADANAPLAAAADYQIQDKLGEGGMGIVFSAIQTAVNRKVALKTLKADRSKDPSSRKQFFYEAEITADLDHPNIPPIYEFGSTDEGIFFYTMKMVKGAEWQRVLTKKTQEENLEIFDKLTDAIAFAHSKDIIHRDIKPENLILGEYGEVYVSDWGMAVNVAKKSSIRFGGTPDYMAPEMANDAEHQIGKTSDIYLLGAVLFQIVTGNPPHGGKNPLERLLAARANKIRSTKLEDPLLDIAMRAMSTQPKDRYATVEDLQTAVHEVQRLRNNISSSIELTNRSRDVAKSAISQKDYDRFNRAMFGLRDALELWEGNRDAAAELQTVRLAYGQCAFERGDYDLALQTLDRKIPDELILWGKAEIAKRTVSTREKRFKTLRNVFLIFLGVSVLGATAAAVVFDNQRRTAIRLKEDAEAAEDVAVAAKQEEERAKNDALTARAEEENAKNEAITARASAVQSQREAEASAALAKERLAQVQLGEQLTKLGFASAQIDQFNPLGAASLLRQLNASSANQTDQPRTPTSQNWAVQRISLLSNLDIPKQELGGPVASVVFALGQTLGIAGMHDGSVRLLNVEGDKLIEQSVQQVGSKVESVVISPNANEAILSASVSNANGGSEHHLFTWDLTQQQPPIRVAETGNRSFQRIAFNPNGSVVVAGIRGGLWARVAQGPWHVCTEKVKGDLLDLAWINNDSVLVLASLSGKNYLYLIEALDRAEAMSAVVEFSETPASQATAIGMSGNRILIGMENGSLELFQLARNEADKPILANGMMLPKRHGRGIEQIRSNGMGRIITTSGEPLAHTWRVRIDDGLDYESFLTGTPSPTSVDNNIDHVEFVDSGRIVNVDSRGVAVVVDVDRQGQRRQLTRSSRTGEESAPYREPVVSVFPRGTLPEVVTVDQKGVVDLWNVQTGRTIPLSGTQAAGQRFSYFGHTPGAELVDTVIDSQNEVVITSAHLPSAAVPYLPNPMHTREFCVWDKRTGAMLRRWSETGDEPRLSLLGRGTLLVGSDTAIKLIDYEGRDIADSLTLAPIAASFGTPSPVDPDVVVLFKRTGGSGMGWLWNRATGKWFDARENFIEFPTSVPVQAVWSSDGQRLYVLEINGTVDAFHKDGDRLVRAPGQKERVQLALKPSLINALRSHHDLDLSIETQGAMDRLVVNVRDAKSSSPETATCKLQFSKEGLLLEQSAETVPELRWLEDLNDVQITPATRIQSKQRIDGRLFVSMDSGSVYGLSSDQSAPVYFGRQPIIGSTSDREAKILLTLHRDGSIWKLDLTEPNQSQWSPIPFMAKNADRIALSPNGLELAMHRADEQTLQILSMSDGQLIREHALIAQFAWDPKQPATLLLVSSDGRVDLSVGAAIERIASLGLGDDRMQKIFFFEERWKEADQEPESYVVVQTQNEKRGKLWFVPIKRRDQVEHEVFSKDIPMDILFTSSPTGSILVSGDSTGTIRIWFASPEFETMAQVYDLQTEADSPILSLAFSGDGDTLITSDGNRRVLGWMSRDQQQ